MKKILLTMGAILLCVMFCAFGLVACGDEEPQTVAVDSVTLNKTEVTLEIGGEETLTATVTPNDATEKTVAWSSDNTAVATVADGKVTAVAAGTATITATADGKSATCSVTVETVKTVTSEQWTQIMESANKFVIEMKQNDNTSTVKIDGDKRMQVFGNEAVICVKEVIEGETKYFSYYYNGESWEKTVVEEGYYSMASRFAEMTTYFKDDFASFTYADGKYTAASLDKTSSPLDSELTNVEITFEDGALTEIKFLVGEVPVVIKDVGITNITVPTDYTDNTGSFQNSVAGQTFVISDMTCEGMDDKTLQAMKEMNEGSTIAFSNDGNVTLTTPKMSVVSTGTYTQNGDEIIITVKEVTMNGESASGEEYSVECTYDGDKLIMASPAGDGIVVYSAFILQIAE